MNIQDIFNKFLAKYNNQFVEKVDSTNKFQCFDLAVAWLDELGLPRSFNHLYAKDIYLNPTAITRQNFNLVPNSPYAVPQAGDIVVWSGTYNGGVGHVAIASGVGDENNFQAFSQNVPTGSNSHLVRFTYNHVVGWLQDKRVNSTPLPIPKPNTMETKKAVQVDKIAAWLKDQGYATDAGTEQYFDNPADPDEFFNKVKSVVAKGKPQLDEMAIRADQKAKDKTAVLEAVSKL